MILELPDEYDSSISPAELLIPRSHNRLGVIRLFLPYEYQGHKSETTRTVRWSELELVRTGNNSVSANAEFFNYIFPVMDEFDGSFLHKDDDSGLLDPQTLAALNDASSSFGRLHGFHWSDLDASPKIGEQIGIFGSKYDRYEFKGGQIDPRYRLPQFVIDENAQFAWGANLFPDSLLIAAPGYICDQLLSDSRVDCALVAPSLPDDLEFAFLPASSQARIPRESTLVTLEMNCADLLALLEKCIFPGNENQPHQGTRQKGIRMQALGGAVLASAALIDDHVQAIATPQYVDPELDIFIPYRDMKRLLKNLKEYSYGRRAILRQNVPTELGLAPKSMGTASITLTSLKSSSFPSQDLTYTVSLSENQNPSMSSSFLTVDAVSENTPYEVSAFYVSWIIDTVGYNISNSSNLIQVGACSNADQRTVITIANVWRISCVTNNDGRVNQ